MSADETARGALDVTCPWCAARPGSPCVEQAAHPTTGRAVLMVTAPHGERAGRIEYGPVHPAGGLFACELISGDRILIPDQVGNYTRPATVVALTAGTDTWTVRVQDADGELEDIETGSDEVWGIVQVML